jgi:hypothetical protein
MTQPTTAMNGRRTAPVFVGSAAIPEPFENSAAWMKIPNIIVDEPRPAAEYHPLDSYCAANS